LRANFPVAIAVPPLYFKNQRLR